MPYVGKKPADIIATAVDTTTGTFSGDLTVDTSTLYVDSANNRVGINTTGSVRDLQIGDNSRSASILSLQTNSSGNGSIYFGDNTTTNAEYGGMIRYSHSDNAMLFWTSSTERLRINSDGNVLIGRTSELNNFGDGRTSLVLQGTGSQDYSTIQLGNNGTASNTQILGILAFYDGTENNARVQAQRATSTDSADLLFWTRPASGSLTERLRIDASGTITTTGALSAKGGAVFNEDSADVDFRVESNDDANMFRIEAATNNVKIGSNAGNYGQLSIKNEKAGSQERGLYVEVTPASGTSPNNVAVFAATNSNMTQPLVRIHHESPTADQLLLQATTTGSNTVKFSVDEDGDIYTAGGVYLGGTGSANKLDDYEEGTWTPTMGGTTTYYQRTGEYTKVGNKVFVRGQVHINAIGTGSTVKIEGLPFTSKTTSNGNPAGALNITYYSNLAIAVNFIAGHVVSAGSHIDIIANAGNNTTIQYNTGNFFGNNTRLDFSMVYQVA